MSAAACWTTGWRSLSRVKARAFFALAAGQPAAEEGEIPILVYNPHPYPGPRRVVECEFQLARPELGRHVHHAAASITTASRCPRQIEKERATSASTGASAWSSRPSWRPAQMNRFDCRLEERPAKPQPAARRQPTARFVFKTDELEVVINTTHRPDRPLPVDGVDLPPPGAFEPLVIERQRGPVGHARPQLPRASAGRFKLMSPQRTRAASPASPPATLPSVRVIEDGAGADGRRGRVRLWTTPSSASATCCPSRAPRSRSRPASTGTRRTGCSSCRPDPGAALTATSARSPTACRSCPPTATRPSRRSGWRWSRTTGTRPHLHQRRRLRLRLLRRRLRLTLLRSPAYSAHPSADRPLVPQDRLHPRIDQGERLSASGSTAARRGHRLAAIDREALVQNEKPIALSFFPSGQGKPLCRSSRSATTSSR